MFFHFQSNKRAESSSKLSSNLTFISILRSTSVFRIFFYLRKRETCNRNHRIQYSFYVPRVYFESSILFLFTEEKRDVIVIITIILQFFRSLDLQTFRFQNHKRASSSKSSSPILHSTCFEYFSFH